jgi:4-amino-4-deoxy-L-arabinose transferase-like glycosyltransferase
LTQEESRNTEPAAVAQNRRADRVAYGLLTALWLSHVLVNLLWLKMDTRPPFWDMAGHAIETIRMSRLPFTTDFWTAFQWLFTVGDYPPLVYWLSVPLGLIFWPTADVFTAISVLFLGILILSTYGLARTLGGRLAGLLAAFIVSMYPLVFGLSRHYLLEVPLVAMVAVSNWLLLRTDSFDRRGVTLAYGLSLGLGMLTKWSFALFVIGPLLVTAVHALKLPPRHRRRNLAMALVVGAVVAAPWYVVNLRTLSKFLGYMSIYGPAEGDPAVGSLASWGYYLQAFVNEQVLLPFALCFGLGLIVLLMKRKFEYKTVFLLCWIVLPYLYFSVLHNKDVRYSMPYLPATAIITAQGLTLLRPKAAKVGVVALLALYAVFQFMGLSWGLSYRVPAGLIPSHIAVSVGPARLSVYAQQVHVASPPRAEDWQAQAILNDVVRFSQARSEARPLTLVVLPDAAWFEKNVFEYYALTDRLPIEAVAVTGVVEVSDARARVLAGDYVITKTGSLGLAWTVQQAGQFSEELGDPTSELGRQFALIATYDLPDGTTAMLYKHAPLHE